MPFVFLAVGFVLLVKGADVMVDGSAGIAAYFRIPSLIIGLTIVAFGTSAPEAAVSITASITGQGDISIGNITGSVIFNTLMVLGICALIKPLHVNRKILSRDFLIMLIACAALVALSVDFWLGDGSEGLLTRGDGIVLGLLFCIFMFVTIKAGIKGSKQQKHEELKQQELEQVREENEKALEESRKEAEKEAEKEKRIEKPVKLMKSIIFAVLGLAAVVLGGQLVVNGASDVARMFGMSETLIGLTVCAVGTSLPELVTSIMAARKGDNDMAVGNVIGSNIFNILFILSACSIIRPMAIDFNSAIDTIIMLGIGIVTFIFCLTGKRINRVEGGIMVLMYAAFMAFAIIR